MRKTKIRLGLDIGSVAVKAAAIDPENKLLAHAYKRSHGQPIQTVLAALEEIFESVNPEDVESLGVTGTAGETVAELTGGEFVNEIVAQAKTITTFFPQVRTLIEMGGEDSKMLMFTEEEGETVLEDFSMNNLCAAGTGSFLDQQASRMGYDIAEEFGEIALKSKHAPRIAGRCSVFAKSDMIHLQQIGTPDYEIIAGLCGAVARSFVSNVGRGQAFQAPVAFFGGVSRNAGVVKALADELELEPDQITIPDISAVTGAMGAALGAQNELESAIDLDKLRNYRAAKSASRASMAPLTGEKNDESYQTSIAPLTEEKTDCYIGIDIGSLSTNVVAINDKMEVIARRYLRTQSRPIQAVTRGLKEIGEEIDGQVNVLGVGTTGSGRYMIGDFVGADAIRNEITAQATAAIHFIPDVDTIFEIGGQDSKYVSVKAGTVVDFEMNKVCAAGTGSFIEEQAEKIGLDIEREFSDTAFAASSPGKFGDRCTVFIESDLVSNQQKGMHKEDLAAGLAYSIVSNYINRVVGDRIIGDKILFQGGVAWNKAVVAAFEAITGKEVAVPPHHDVTGAVGAALIAKKQRERLGAEAPASRFIGFDLSERKYKLTTFECKACDNVCDVSRVKFDKEAHFYGARCDLFDAKSARKKNAKGVELPDLYAERDRMIFGEWLNAKTPPRTEKKRIGLPRALYFYEHFPFWSTLLTELGFEVVLSSRTNQNVIAEAIEAVKAETCFPVKVIHGHVRDLLKKDIDYLFIPATITVKGGEEGFKHNYTCPYVQSMPHMIKAAIDVSSVKTLEPPVFFHRGDDYVAKNLAKFFKKEMGVAPADVREAVKKGRAAQNAFYAAAIDRGTEVIRELNAKGEKPTLIISRPYNGCDSGINLDLPRKLRDMGKVAIPIDFVPLDESKIVDQYKDMFWRSGQRMISAANFLRENDGVDGVFISNFKCGPDSFIEYHLKETLAGKPMLGLEIDEHSADAGAVTRLEAFFDSLENAAGSYAISAERHEESAEMSCGAPPIQGELAPFSDEQVDVVGANGHAANGHAANGHGANGHHANGNGAAKKDGVEKEKKVRKIYIPYMCEHVYPLASAMRGAGIDAGVLPMSDEESLDIGRQLSTGKECIPFTLTSGDMIKMTKQEGFDPDATAFMMPTASGPCRFGQYNSVQNYYLRDHGLDFPLFSPDSDDGYASSTRMMDFVKFRRDSWRGIVMTDILLKLVHYTRPYELHEGETDALYDELFAKMNRHIENDSSKLFAFAREARDRFAAVKVDRSVQKPVIGMVGEIYLRSHPFSNQNLIRRVEKLGGEIWQAPVGEWFGYSTFIYLDNAIKDKKYLDVLKAYMQDRIQHKDERKLLEPFKEALKDRMDAHTRALLDKANPYLDRAFEGEAVLSIGKAVEYYEMGLSGIVNVMPFSCMPGTVVAAISGKVREDHDNIPWLNLDYDGVEETNTQTRLEAFMYQAGKFRSQRAVTT